MSYEWDLERLVCSQQLDLKNIKNQICPSCDRKTFMILDRLYKENRKIALLVMGKKDGDGNGID